MHAGELHSEPPGRPPRGCELIYLVPSDKMLPFHV